MPKRSAGACASTKAISKKAKTKPEKVGLHVDSVRNDHPGGRCELACATSSTALTRALLQCCVRSYIPCTSPGA